MQNCILFGTAFKEVIPQSLESKDAFEEYCTSAFHSSFEMFVPSCNNLDSSLRIIRKDKLFSDISDMKA